MTIDPAALLDELGLEVSKVQLGQNANYRRLRIAVSPEEYRALERYCHHTGDGKFWSRIRLVPLIVDDAPETPMLAFSQGPGAKA